MTIVYLGDSAISLSNTPDHKFGFGHEDALEETIATYFNTKLTKLSRYHKFDFMTEDNVFIELKSRRVKHDSYPTTMLGMDKINSLTPTEKAIFVFNFTDGVYYYEYSSNSTLAFQIRLGGRTDRGCVEQKEYAYIPITLLKRFKRSGAMHHTRICAPVAFGDEPPISGTTTYE